MFDIIIAASINDRTLMDKIRVNSLMLKLEIAMAHIDFIYWRQRRSMSIS